MKQQILSVALALCLCTSSLPAVCAGQEAFSPQEGVPTEEAASELILCDESGIPTPTEVYDAMIALQEDERYKEGTTWTNDEPYSDSKGNYHWKGGALNGVNIVAAGCVAFAFILSDAAFGDLPARMYAAGGFSYEDIKVGDILRVNGDAHTVIVLRVTEGGVVVAEGNYNGTTHWGRPLSKEEVMSSTSHYITRYPNGYVAPDDPAASIIIDEGNLDGGLTWRLTGAGTLTVSGNGAMPDFGGTQEQPWRSYSDQILTVIIEEGVTGIGDNAFWECGVLTVKISSTVTSIGASAFRQSSIIAVAIPPSVKTIGDDAFRECLNLTTLTISEGGESIGERAFRGCIKLASVNLPASIKSMGAGAFYDCEELSSVIFASGSNNNPVTMGENLFARCWKLSTVTLPESIDCISNGMFQNCYYALYSLSIPQGATKIGDSAFASCGVLTYLTIPDSVTDIESGAFSSCGSLTEIRFTGTEEQWQKIWKANNVTEALANVTIHYGYSPTPTPTPDPTTVPDATTAPDTTPEPDATQEPDATTVPDTTSEPGATTTPDATPEPDATTTPDATPEPDATATPDVTSEPGGTTAPGTTQEPDATTAPDATQEPDMTATPEPGATAAPDATPEPDTTAAPDVTPAPDVTTTPDITPVPTPEPGATSAPESTLQPDVTPVPNPTTAPVPTQAPVVPTPVPVPTPDTKIPFIKGESGKEGWEAVKEDAAVAFDGKWLNVNMNGASVVPGNVLDSIKGQNVTIAFDMGNGLIWFVNGKNVTAEHANDVDFSAKVGSSNIPQDTVGRVAGNRQSTQLALAYDGYFGYSAVLMINLGSANAGLYANLYYYNETTGTLEFVTVDQINEDGIAELVFSHASDYVVVVGEDVMGGNSNGTSSGSNNGSVSANGGNSQGTGVRSPKTGEYDTVIGGANAAELQHKGNNLNLMWLFLAGAAMMSVMGTITVLIYRKVNK